MKPFVYIVAHTVPEAVSALRRHGGAARVLAGGTDLLSELRRPGAAQPEVVVDISRIKSLRRISREGEVILLGPLATHAELVQSGLVRSGAPLLGLAAASIGSPQIRNRGTIGGNIMNAAACADTVPPLIALGAVATLTSADGERRCHMSGFFARPYATVARKDELLTQVRFDALPAGARSSFVKLGRRNALAISRLSVATVVVTDAEGLIADVRIVPGAAFSVWKRIMEAEHLLIGKPPSTALFAEAGRVVAGTMVRETGRRWSTEYKEPVIAALARRALERCFELDAR
ncbi:MAG TPA: FAD binding domain-containing protein [Bacteroidota bacterium]|nr:FAD binding domain-containing protein [Bacteroidota bacterium]